MDPPILSLSFHFNTLKIMPHSHAVLVGFSIDVIKYNGQKQPGEKGVCFSLQLVVYHPEKSGQELGSRNHGGIVLTDLVLWPFQPAFLYKSDQTAQDQIAQNHRLRTMLLGTTGSGPNSSEPHCSGPQAQDHTAQDHTAQDHADQDHTAQDHRLRATLLRTTGSGPHGSGSCRPIA